jgi:hypothetical protein
MSKLVEVLLLATLIAVAQGGGTAAWLDFTPAKASAGSWQPAPGATSASPFFFGNHIMLQNVHINNGESIGFVDEIRAVILRTLYQSFPDLDLFPELGW